MKLSKNLQNLFLIIHIGILLFLLASPILVSKKFVNRYGNIIAYFMASVVFSWLIFGKCPLGAIENTDSDGSFIKFLKHILKINIKGYENQIKYVTGILYTYAMYFYSKYNINFLYIALFYNIISALQMM